MQQESMVSIALGYLRRGWSIIPIKSGDKKPLISSWREFQNRLPTEKEVTKWFSQWPKAGIAVVTGKISGIVVIDIEKGGSPKEFPPTLMSRSGGGGYHLYYAYPNQPVKNSVKVLGELIDVRGDGGYIVLPPSLHSSGKRYQWVQDNSEKAIEALPERVLKSQVAKTEKINWSEYSSKKVVQGQRNNTAAQLAGKLLFAFPPEQWPTAWETLKAWNSENCVPPLSEKELKAVFESIKKLQQQQRKEGKKVKLLPRERIAVCPPPIQRVNCERWRRVILSNFPDLLLSAEASASMLAQLLIKEITNPCAIVLVDVPSSGKTININFFDALPDLTYSSDKFTPASFVSNASNIKKEDLAEIDLLPRIQYRMLLVRDFATLFSKREEDLKELLGIMTRVLDGEGLNTDTGVHGKRQYNGEYFFLLLAASTPIPPRVWKIMGNLGSRLFFLSINSRNKTEDELVEQVIDRAYKEKERACHLATKDFLYGLWRSNNKGIDWDKKADDKSVVAKIARCAMLLANLRGVINVYTDDFLQQDKFESPVIEKPDRINQLYYNLARGHAVISGRTQISGDDLHLIIALTLDSSPNNRSRIFKALLQHKGEMKTSEVEATLNISKPTALKEMKQLKILGICTENEDVNKDVNKEYSIKLVDKFSWFLSEEFLHLAKDLIKQI